MYRTATQWPTDEYDGKPSSIERLPLFIALARASGASKDPVYEDSHRVQYFHYGHDIARALEWAYRNLLEKKRFVEDGRNCFYTDVVAAEMVASDYASASWPTIKSDDEVVLEAIQIGTIEHEENQALWMDNYKIKDEAEARPGSLRV